MRDFKYSSQLVYFPALNAVGVAIYSRAPTQLNSFHSNGTTVMVFVCTLCSQFAAHTYLPVLSHIGSVHRFGATKRIECGIDGCPASYTTNTYESFRSHVYRKHRDVLYSQDVEDTQLNPQGSVVLQFLLQLFKQLLRT